MHKISVKTNKQNKTRHCGTSPKEVNLSISLGVSTPGYYIMQPGYYYFSHSTPIKLLFYTFICRLFKSKQFQQGCADFLINLLVLSFPRLATINEPAPSSGLEISTLTQRKIYTTKIFDNVLGHYQ